MHTNILNLFKKTGIKMAAHVIIFTFERLRRAFTGKKRKSTATLVLAMNRSIAGSIQRRILLGSYGESREYTKI
jgi:hypothetical protein